MALKTKHRMLKEDWGFFKQRLFIEEQVRKSPTISTVLQNELSQN